MREKLDRRGVEGQLNDGGGESDWQKIRKGRRETQWILTEVKWAHTEARASMNVCCARRLQQWA